jgi:hypothetical protein
MTRPYPAGTQLQERQARGVLPDGRAVELIEQLPAPACPLAGHPAEYPRIQPGDFLAAAHSAWLGRKPQPTGRVFHGPSRTAEQEWVPLEGEAEAAWPLHEVLEEEVLS